MPASNREVAAAFERLADLLEIEDANPFRVRAYRNAARTIGSLPRSLAELIATGEDPDDLPGIGKDLAAKIREFVGTRRLKLLDEVAARTPAGLSDVMRVEGIGPARARALHQALGVASVTDLARAIEARRVRTLPGFGVRTEARLRAAIGRVARSGARIRLVDAEHAAEPIVAQLKSLPGVGAVEVAGSFRRRRETVGDLDILASAARGADVVDRFVAGGDVAEVVAAGRTRATVRLVDGLQVDLRVVPAASFGAALYYFTGSRQHNIALRKLAMQRGLKVNEYGVFDQEGKRVAGSTEAEVLRSVGLPFIEPELRENRGEIEAARAGRLPALLEPAHIRGDLHCHTRDSDGHDTLEEMARAAQALGYEYLAISDHTQHLGVAHGLDATRLARQIEAIDRLNDELDGLVLLKSAEVDILEDGSLDLDEDTLARLDFTVCAVHDGFGLSKARRTARILRAMDNPRLNVLAHPTGRLIGRRESCALDVERVLHAAKERGCLLELNAHPDRLDLDDESCRLAKEIGVKLAIGTDAHSAADLRFMRFGVAQARRGWLERDDVANTRSLAALRRLLHRS